MVVVPVESTEMASDDPLLRRLREAAALRLWELEAIRVRSGVPFRLASGDPSPIYFDCRLAVSDPLILGILASTTRRFRLQGRAVGDVLAGGETAGIPFAAHLASSLSLPMVYVRKKAKGHGRGRRIEGRLAEGARVLLVEDLITDGGSKLGFVDAVEEAGGTVTGVLVLFDREQGGASVLESRGVDLAAATDRTTALAVGRETGRVSQRELDELEGYFDDPTAWVAARRS